MKFFVLAIFMALTSCAVLREGTVANVVSEHEADVYLDPSEVHGGDRVAFFRQECDTLSFKSKRCHPYKTGEGSVSKVDGETARVAADKGVKITWDTEVQVINRSKK